MSSVIIHDNRIAGYVPWGRALEIDKNSSVHGTFQMAAFNASVLGRPRRLVIMAHGLRTPDGHFFVGMGQGLTLHNVHVASCLRGVFQKIKLKVCGTQLPGYEDEMRALYAALARAAETPVIAADAEQLYRHHDQPLDALDLALGRGAIDFGEWEGQVWEYPVRGPRRMVHGHRE